MSENTTGHLPDAYLGGDGPTPVMQPYHRALNLVGEITGHLVTMGIDYETATLPQLKEAIRAVAVNEVGIDPTPDKSRPIEERFPVGTRLRWVENEGLAAPADMTHPLPDATIINWSPVWDWQSNAPKPKLYYSERLEVLFDGETEFRSFSEHVLTSAFAPIPVGVPS